MVTIFGKIIVDDLFLVIDFKGIKVVKKRLKIND